MNNKGKHAKQKFQVVEMYTVLLFIAFIFMSIGYAQISDIDMIISGQAEATAQNGVFIYDVADAVGTNGADAANSTVETYFGSNLATKVVLGDSTESTISYTVSLYNNSSDRYVFVGVSDPALYDNDDIVYTLSDNMIVGSTILEPNGNGKSLDFTLTFKYADGVTPTDTNKVLNSMLNFRFKELPRVVLNVGKITDAVSEAVDIYPGFGAYEYSFIVENFDGTATNKVEMEYTLGLEVAELPEGSSESPLTLTLDNDSVLDNEALIEDILIAGGDGVEEKTDNYVLRIAWNDKALNGAKKYNSADFAGKTFKYKVTLTGTPSEDVYEKQYLDYQFIKSFILEVTTAPLNFNVNMTEADIFMEGDKASLTLGINNNSDADYDTEYNVKVNDNTKFTATISDATNSSAAITSDGTDRILNSGIDTNDVFTIDFAADVNDIDRKEVVNVLLSLTTPYVKEITIPVNIRSIVMSAKNVKDGNDATGTNAQVTNGNVNVTINCDGTYLDSANNKNLQYAVVENGGSLNENNWQTINTSEISNLNTTNAEVTKTVSVNGNVYARYFDGTNGYGTTQIAIDNIDKESPNAFSVNKDTVTTYSVKVNGSTTDRKSNGTNDKYVGVSGYQYQLKKEDGTVLKAWTPETETTETSYTFVSDTSNDLEITQGTKYIVSMRAIDLAGNMSEEASVEVTTDAVADSSSEANIGISYSETTATKKDVVVYFTNNSGNNDLTLKYQIETTNDDGWLSYPETGVSVSTNKTVYARLFDAAGQYKNTATATVGNIDKLAPITAVLSENDVEETTFTLNVMGGDADATSEYSCSGMAKYEFYIDGVLEETITSKSVTASYNVTEKAANTSYVCKVRVYDAAGNYKESDEITVTTKTAGVAIASVVNVGDFVDYDAGTWSQANDTANITASGGSIDWSGSMPTSHLQFGGITDGKSRNSNTSSYPYVGNGYEVTPKYSGWRVWDINKTTGVVTLISAGHPETIFVNCNNYSAEDAERILLNRNYSMYVNELASSANVLTKDKMLNWVQCYIDSSIDTTSTYLSLDMDKYNNISEYPLIDILNINSSYWITYAYDSYNFYWYYGFNGAEGFEDRAYFNMGFEVSNAKGIRILVDLLPNVLVNPNSGDGKVDTPWQFVDSGGSGVDNNIEVVYDVTEPTQGNVNMSFKYNTDFTLQYQIGSTTGTWLNYSGQLLKFTTNGIVYVRLIDSNGVVLKATTASVGNIDRLTPVNTEIEICDIGRTTFILRMRGYDADSTTEYNWSGIEKYEIFVNGSLEKTGIISDGSINYEDVEITGKTMNTTYTCKMRVYDKAGNYTDSSEITVTTKGADLTVGDFVNYSVTVDEVIYDQWRVLHLNTNGHIEIVCYEGPEYEMGHYSDTAIGKLAYLNCIQMLNDESQPYKNGTYGYSARHLGSNPTNPSSYATIAESYLYYYTNTTIPSSIAKYVDNTHYLTDTEAVKSFPGTNKLFPGDKWLAARTVDAESYGTCFGTYYIAGRDGDVTGGTDIFFSWADSLFEIDSDGTEEVMSQDYGLAPVVALEAGVKQGSGEGTILNPVQLIK